MAKKVLTVILCICAFIFPACNFPSLNGFLISEVLECEFFDGNKNAAKKEILQFLEDFENKTSVNVKDSDVSRINGAVANEKVEVSDCVIDLINVSKAAYNETEGAFNPCIYPIFKLYDFYGKKIVPSDKAIEELLPYININDLTVIGNSVIKKYDKMQIDFGAIAKGYAADKCVEIAKKHGVTSGFVNLGGDFRVFGTNPISIGITNPRSEEKAYFGVIDLAEISGVTSGDYVRFFELDGVRYCHILDGITGKKSDSNLVSVTVFGKDPTLCEVYSTALFVMGMDRAIEFTNSNLKDFKVILINENREYYKSGGLDIYDIDSAYTIYG